MLSQTDIKYFKLAVGSESIGMESSIDIVARCPVCGDSKKNKNKKRLHLYNKSNETRVNCFNGDCPVTNRTVYGFLRDHYPSLLDQYKRENFGNTLEKLSKGDVFSSFKESTTSPKADILIHDLSPYLKEITESKEALEYIKGRGYDYNENDYGKWYFGFQNLNINNKFYPITDSIVIPLYYKKQMYGFYSRSILNKTFTTYMHDANIGYKIWNWFNVDLNKPIYIFEGIFDAIASGLDNSIALISATIPPERLEEIKEPVFVLDNDRTGLINALKYSKDFKNKIYIQPKEFKEKDINELKLKHSSIKIDDMIKANLFNGLSAQIRIKRKL